jgi:hypothetical protein
MLDIRAVAYVAPVSEVDFASVTLTVRIANVADESGIVTGKFRVYNDTTGLLIHTSDIVPFSLAAGATVDASALTDFDPPAPADDVYFVIFDGKATNALVPDGITFTLGQFYFDVKPTGMGPAPAAHHATHENGGSDPLDHGVLPGLADDDHLQYQLRGEKGTAGGFCGLPDPLDTTLPLRADGTPNRPDGLLAQWDLLNLPSFEAGFTKTDVSSGVTSALAPLANHPGLATIAARAVPAGLSGVTFHCGLSSILIAGGEVATVIFKTAGLAGASIRAGFIDSASADATDGAYCEMIQVGGVDGTLVGKTAAAAARSTTASSFVMSASTWYRITVQVNATATLVTFSLFDSTGALIWSDSLNSNIPTTPGQETSCGFQSLSTTGLSTLISTLDFISVWLARIFAR